MWRVGAAAVILGALCAALSPNDVSQSSFVTAGSSLRAGNELRQEVDFHSLAPSSTVRHVNTSVFDPNQFDAIFDVRNQDEWAGRGLTAHSCSIGTADPDGCSYGHLSEAVCRVAAVRHSKLMWCSGGLHNSFTVAKGTCHIRNEAAPGASNRPPTS